MFVDRCDGCLHVLSDYRCSAGSAGHFFISVIIFFKNYYSLCCYYCI